MLKKNFAQTKKKRTKTSISLRLSKKSKKEKTNNNKTNKTNKEGVEDKEYNTIAKYKT